MPRGVRKNQETKAIHNPVIMSGQLAGSQQDIGQGKARHIEADGDKVELSPQTVIIADKVYDNEKMAMLAFFNEPLTLRILTTADKAAEQKFEININGQPKLFQRGQSYTVPRYYVDRILRLKNTHYGQQEVTNSQGVRSYQYPPITTMKYDYVIERDDNPRGKDWERAVLSESS